MFAMVDTAFSCGRVLIVCLFRRKSSKVKESSFHEIWNADTAFLLNRASWVSSLSLYSAIPRFNTFMANKSHTNIDQITTFGKYEWWKCLFLAIFLYQAGSVNAWRNHMTYIHYLCVWSFLLVWQFQLDTYVSTFWLGVIEYLWVMHFKRTKKLFKNLE